MELDRAGKQSIYLQIYSILLEEIQNGIYSNTCILPSEKSLCVRFNVERNTVRKALQVLVNEKIIKKRPGYGAVLADKNNPGDNSEISVSDLTEMARKNILLAAYSDYLHDNGENFHFRLINGFEKKLSKMGYNLIFKSVDMGISFRDIIRQTMPAAIIYDSYMHEEWYREGIEANLPCISINHSTPLMSSIVSNNFDGAFKVAKMLAEANHRRIAVITGKKDYQTNIERMSGLQQLYLKEGMASGEMLVLDGDWSFSSGVKAGERILGIPESGRPTAVFAFNDDMAFGCYSCFVRAGLKVPDDISIAGFDKSNRYNHIFPGITTVDVNINAMIEYACWILSGYLSSTAPNYSVNIQIDTTIYDNGTIRPIL